MSKSGIRVRVRFKFRMWASVGEWVGVRSNFSSNEPLRNMATVTRKSRQKITPLFFRGSASATSLSFFASVFFSSFFLEARVAIAKKRSLKRWGKPETAVTHFIMTSNHCQVLNPG